MGENIVYILVEKLREILDKPTKESLIKTTSLCNQLEVVDAESQKLENTSSAKNFTIVTGDPFTDRKSTFQAHVAPLRNQISVR